MTGYILKLSYNAVGDNDLEGGICGSCFSVKKGEILTAQHVLKGDSFKPNDGYQACQVWIVFDEVVIEIFESQISEFADIDTTKICISQQNCISTLNIDNDGRIQTGTFCQNEGFVAESMPRLICYKWSTDRFVISRADMNEHKVKGEGSIVRVEKTSIPACDVKLKNVDLIELDYGGPIGMSGGPLLTKDKGAVLGLMSIGIPPGRDIKMKTKLFAVSIHDILNQIQ